MDFGEDPGVELRYNGQARGAGCSSLFLHRIRMCTFPFLFHQTGILIETVAFVVLVISLSFAVVTRSSYGSWLHLCDLNVV